MDVEELVEVVTGLGTFKRDENHSIEYVIEDDTAECLQDIIRIIKRDDPSEREAFKKLGEWNVIKKHVVPILCMSNQDRAIFIPALKVAVLLTLPIDPASSGVDKQQYYLRSFKAAFISGDALGSLVQSLQEPLININANLLSIPGDVSIFDLILTLIRNLLAIPDSNLLSPSTANDHYGQLQQTFINKLFEQELMSVFLSIASNISKPAYRTKNLLLIEILYYVVKDCDPERVISPKVVESQSPPTDEDSCLKDFTNKVNDNKELLSLLVEDRKRRKRNSGPARHSNFGGLYKSKHIGGLETLSRSAPQKQANQSFRYRTASSITSSKSRRANSKRIGFWDGKYHSHEYGPFSKSTFEYIREFSGSFLALGYTNFMRSVKRDICNGGKGILRSDFLHFLAVARFFTEFVVASQQYSERESWKCEHVADTVDEESLNLAVRKLLENVKDSRDESLSRDDADIQYAIASLEFLYSTFKLLKITLKPAMGKSVQELEDENDFNVIVASTLLYRTFQDHTESGLLPGILVGVPVPNNSVKVVYVTKSAGLMRALKTFDQTSQPKSFLQDLVVLTDLVLELLNTMSLSMGKLKIQVKRRRNKKKKETGTKEISSEKSPPEEPGEITIKNNDLETVHEPHGGNVPNTSPPLIPEGSSGDHIQNATQNPANEKAPLDHDNSPEKSADKDDIASRSKEASAKGLDDDDDDDEVSAEVKEVVFDFVGFVNKFVGPSLVDNLCYILSDYRRNEPALQMAITRMISRISKDCQLEPLFFQLSTMVLFYQILNDEDFTRSPRACDRTVREICQKTVRHLVRNLKTKTGPVLLVDLMFTKNREICHHIEANYFLAEYGANIGKANLGERLGEDEDTTIVVEKKRILGKRTRLKWTEEMDGKLSSLFETLKDNVNSMEAIAAQFSPISVRPSQIKRRLRTLGLLIPTKDDDDESNDNDLGAEKRDIDILARSNTFDHEIAHTNNFEIGESGPTIDTCPQKISSESEQLLETSGSEDSSSPSPMRNDNAKPMTDDEMCSLPHSKGRLKRSDREVHEDATHDDEDDLQDENQHNENANGRPFTGQLCSDSE